MSVLVDTSVWSLVLRKTSSHTSRWQEEMRALVSHSRVKLMGPIRQEILSGIRDRKVFEALRERLLTFPDVPIATGDYERAAEFFNACRSKGIQGSHIDFLICAVAHHNDWEIFTADGDFRHYEKITGIKLYRM